MPLGTKTTQEIAIRGMEFSKSTFVSKSGPSQQKLLFVLYPARPPAARRNQIKGNLPLAFQLPPGHKQIGRQVEGEDN